MLRLSLLRVCASSARLMVVLRSRYFVTLSTKRHSSGSSLPPFLVSTLPDAFKLRNQIGEARCDYFLFAAYNNLRRQVQSRQLNSGELDVTPMCRCYCNDVSGSSGAESRQHGTQSTIQNPLYNIQSLGDERQLAGRVSCSKLRSKSGMYNHRHMNQDTHYSSHMKPKSLYSHYRIQPVLQTTCHA